jgi:hypothetical protein
MEVTSGDRLDALERAFVAEAQSRTDRDMAADTGVGVLI